MRHVAVGLLCCVAFSAGVVHADPPGADPSRQRANQTFDAGVFRVFFTAPSWGETYTSPVLFEFDITGEFTNDRGLGCSPAGTCYGKEPQFRLDDTGHCHIYIENADTKDLEVFSAACVSPDLIELTPNNYCAYIDLTHNDHVARYKPGPQDLPPFDKVCFTVVVE